MRDDACSAASCMQMPLAWRYTLLVPPVLLAQFGADPAKKTIVVYGHLDVQPAQLSDGWNTDPW